MHQRTRFLPAAAAAAAFASLLAVPGPPAAAAAGERQAGPAAAYAALVISYRSAPEVAAQTWTLTCGPVGGTHPAPEEACTRIAVLTNPFAPVSVGTRCATIYGGAQAATVLGTLGDDQVHAEFHRRGSCAIARWNAHAPIVAPTQN